MSRNRKRHRGYDSNYNTGGRKRRCYGGNYYYDYYDDEDEDDDYVNEYGWVDPTGFLALGARFHNTNVNPNLIGSDGLSVAVWDHFSRRKESAGNFNRKIEIWRILNDVVHSDWGCSSHAYGSTLSGFGFDGSDLDLCLFHTYSDTSDTSTLAHMRKVIRRRCRDFIDPDIELIHAKVPILKLYDFKYDIEIDISCNNETGVRNTTLLFWYSQVDWRVRPLLLAIKSWARNEDINDAKNGTLSSYVLSLMTIHYLQAGVTPSVVPTLQQCRQAHFHPESDVFQQPFFQDLGQFQSQNNMTLGQLLIGFFDYYCDKYDFSIDVGSVRTGQRLTNDSCVSYSRQVRDGLGQWNAYVCIEEPFNRSNAGRAVIKRPMFDKIINAFKKTQNFLRSGSCFNCFVQSCPQHNNT